MQTNRVFSEEKWVKVLKANKELLEDYLTELKSKRRRPKTIEQYRFDGRMLLCYIFTDMDNKYLIDFTKKDFRKISLWLTEERKVSNARFNRVFSLIRGMMEYAEDEDDYDYERNMARKIKGLEKEPVRDICFLSDEQIHKIRDYLLEKELYRECVYLDLSYDSAGRIGEIAQVQKHDLLNRRNTNIVVGKRGKKFPLIYHNNTLESLKLWLDERGEDDLDELFVTTRYDTKRVVTEDALYEWCVRFRGILCELEGTYIKFTPHSFRHSALENYKRGTHYMCKELGKPDGFTIEELQILANHESMDTTKSYLKDDKEDVLQNMFNIKIG